jgi:hypothetical protein
MPWNEDLRRAYLAGIIDGEGTLTITRHIRKDRPGYTRFNLRLAVYNTNLGLLSELKEWFGGTIMIAERIGENWKPVGQLAWSEEQLVVLLPKIIPYLLIKREQAEILLAAQATKMTATEGRRNGLSAEVVEIREASYLRLKSLNKRGRDAVENAKAS